MRVRINTSLGAGRKLVSRSKRHASDEELISPDLTLVGLRSYTQPICAALHAVRCRRCAMQHQINLVNFRRSFIRSSSAIHMSDYNAQ